MATAKKCEKDATYFENFHQWDAEVVTYSVLSQGSNYADRRVIIIIIMLTLQRHLFTSASEHFWASTSLLDVATKQQQQQLEMFFNTSDLSFGSEGTKD